MRRQEEPGGDRESQGEPGDVRESQEEPGEVRSLSIHGLIKPCTIKNKSDFPYSIVAVELV